MSIAVQLDPPSRQDKPNFPIKADRLMADLVVWTQQANALAAEVNAAQSTASQSAQTATDQASLATASRDIAMAAVNYKGVYANLVGALSIPASTYYNGSIWMLTQNVGNVAAEVPGVSTKWLNVTPASGLGSAAYHSAGDFQPAIGALTGILIGAGGGNISAATAAQLVSAIGTTYVANATRASSAGSADLATAIMDGAVSAAAKIANKIITWAKLVNIPTGKLLGRSTAGDGDVEELSIGSGLSLSNGTLSCTVTAPVTSVGNYTGSVTNAQVAAAAIAGGAAPASGASYAPLTSFVSAAAANGAPLIGGYIVAKTIVFTRANGTTFNLDVIWPDPTPGGGG